MQQILIVLLAATLAACATTPKPFAMTEDARLFLVADMAGTMTDSQGQVFTLRKLKKLIDAGAPVPHAIDVEINPDMKMGALITLCAELNAIEGNIKIHVPPEYKGEIQTVNCE